MINNIINKVGVDKILHLLVCLSLTLELRRFVDLWIAVLIVFVIAVLKEVYDKDDGFYIESTTDGKPFYWSTLVFDEEKEIPKNIVDLIEQNGIQFTKAGKPVDNPDKYSISIDVDTNKITVITK